MDLLLVQTTPAMGGANKANRALLASLAALGHRCRLLTSAISAGQEATPESVVDGLRARGLSVEITENGGMAVYREHGVEIHALLREAEDDRLLRRQIDDFDPTWLLVSEEDVALYLLQVCLDARPDRVVFISHTPLLLPCGPDCFCPNEARTALIQRAKGFLAPSDYLRDYLREWAGVPAETVRFPVYGKPPFRRFSNFDKGYVTLVNPSAFKGLPIFLELARAFPKIDFAAVPTWGTSDDDLRQLRALENVTLIDPVADIDDLFVQTRILLAPSLWAEAFGQIALEAMLRGLPVISSNSGGLPEANCGVEPILPVTTIQSYERRFDQRMLPVPIVPEQEIEPWVEALGKLLDDRRHYDTVAERSHQASHRFVEAVEGTSGPTVVRYLESLAPAAPADAISDSLSTHLPHLSTQTRQRLRGWLDR